MLKFKNFGINTKLIIGFGIVLTFMSIISVVSLSSLNQSTESTQKLYEKELLGSTYLLEISRDVLAIANVINKSTVQILEGSTDGAKKTLEEFPTRKVALLNNLELVKTTVVRPAAKTKLEELTATMEIYSGNVTKVYNAYQERPDKANANQQFNEFVSTRAYQDTQNKVRSLIKELVDGKIAESKQTFEEASVSGKIANYTVIGIFILSLLVSVLVVVVVGKSINGPITQLEASLGDLANKKLNIEVANTELKNEIGRMANAVANVRTALHTSFSTILENADNLSTSSQEMAQISSSSKDLSAENAAQANQASAAANQVSANMQTVASGVEELTISIREIASNAMESAEVSKSAVDSANVTSNTMQKLGESSKEIGEVLNVISSIAEQTNLLALNATIEAARAGESGKGFAVVANEVKELSRQTSKATEDITQKVNNIQRDVAQAVKSIETIAQIINRINDISGLIATAVEEQSATANEIGKAVAESAQGSNSIAKSINIVSQSSIKTLEGSNLALSESNNLSAMAGELKAIVNQFKL